MEVGSVGGCGHAWMGVVGRRKWAALIVAQSYAWTWQLHHNAPSTADCFNSGLLFPAGAKGQLGRAGACSAVAFASSLLFCEHLTELRGGDGCCLDLIDEDFPVHGQHFTNDAQFPAQLSVCQFEL